MAGIYLHIPFCRKACHYCDFHFSTNRKNESDVIQAMAKEIVLRKDYLTQGIIQTIYFGGGTPSLISPEHLELLLRTIHENFQVSPNAEITLEANPDDLSADSLSAFQKMGINRLSIGVQTFHDPLLEYLNRTHTAGAAAGAFQLARVYGFSNINLDLIYGLPGQTPEMLREDLQKLRLLNPEHISAYALTIEDQTVFGNWYRRGKLKPLPDDQVAEAFILVAEFLTQSGYCHYEVSNYARAGFESKHNSNYWAQVPYLGIGPGAHSFNGTNRQANITNNAIYVKKINAGIIPASAEELTREDRINEHIMTGLRTMAGVDLVYLKEAFDFNLDKSQLQLINNWCALGLLNFDGKRLIATRQGLLMADRLAMDLFLTP